MGYKLLILSIGLSFAFAASYGDIDTLVEKVKERRKGLAPTTIAKLKNPFVNEKKLVKLMKKRTVHHKKRERLRLLSIFNDRVNINGRWYRTGSRIGSYRIIAIDANTVVLQSGKKRLKLFLPKRKSKLIQIVNWR